MNMTSETITIELPSVGESATLTIRRDGQQPPSVGNKVVTKLTIGLPGDEDSLLSTIYFGDKVTVGTRAQNFSQVPDKLYGGWGQWNEETRMRENYAIFITEKWSDGFALARTFGLAEVQKLIDALNVRAEALRNAEA
jgi:hypothetical protein